MCYLIFWTFPVVIYGFSLNHVVCLTNLHHFTFFQFTPSYGQQQNNANALVQYQHPPHTHAPPAGQPWLPSVSQSAAAVTSVQPAGVQPSGTTSTDAVSLCVYFDSLIHVAIVAFIL